MCWSQTPHCGSCLNGKVMRGSVKMLLNLTGFVTVHVNVHKILFDITEEDNILTAVCTADETEYSTNILIYKKPRILPLKNTASLCASGGVQAGQVASSSLRWHIAHSHLQDDLQSPINGHVFGLWEDSRQRGPQLGIQPRTLLLWGNSVNHWK